MGSAALSATVAELKCLPMAFGGWGILICDVPADFCGVSMASLKLLSPEWGDARQHTTGAGNPSSHNSLILPGDWGKSCQADAVPEI